MSAGDDGDEGELAPSGRPDLERPPADDEPPVVARMIVEIRSDGSRTIARGAMEDLESGQRVAIEARGSTPMSLAMSLAKTMVKGRLFARTAARALLPGRKPRR